MNCYEKVVLPKLIHFVCSQKDITRQRRRIIPLAEGRVLEVGMGSGLNLPFYDTKRVDRLWGLEPSCELKAKALRKAGEVSMDVRFIGMSGEEIPLDTNSMDTVVVTYTLCTIPDVQKALHEMRRVLRPGGRLLFCEHGRSPDQHIFKWQDRINPAWRKIAGGCNLNRQIASLVHQSGFKIRQLEQEYASTLKIISFNYRGVAFKP